MAAKDVAAKKIAKMATSASAQRLERRSQQLSQCLSSSSRPRATCLSGVEGLGREGGRESVCVYTRARAHACTQHQPYRMQSTCAHSTARIENLQDASTSAESSSVHGMTLSIAWTARGAKSVSRTLPRPSTLPSPPPLPPTPSPVCVRWVPSPLPPLPPPPPAVAGLLSPHRAGGAGGGSDGDGGGNLLARFERPRELDTDEVAHLKRTHPIVREHIL